MYSSFVIPIPSMLAFAWLLLGVVPACMNTQADTGSGRVTLQLDSQR